MEKTYTYIVTSGDELIGEGVFHETTLDKLKMKLIEDGELDDRDEETITIWRVENRYEYETSIMPQLKLVKEGVL